MGQGSNGVSNVSRVTTDDSRFGQTAVRIGFDDAVSLVQRNVKGATGLDPAIVGEIIAGALSLGAYVGAELAIEGIMPPEQERECFSQRFLDSRARLDAVVQHAQEQIAKALTEAQENPQ